MRTALSIAGSDPSGGAGIQADLKTMTLNGVYAMSAITALTVQNTTGVQDVLPVPPAFLAGQIDAVFQDIRPDAVKVGMVPSAALAEAAAERLAFYKAENIVVDPVLASTSGHDLTGAEAVSVLRERLLPLAALVTPNIPEAEALSGVAIHSPADMETAARIIADSCGCAVLVKGGHAAGGADDLLWAGGRAAWYPGRRVENPNSHGTGCTLSSAIAADLAKGFALEEAVRRAKDYVTGALEAMLDLGTGRGPMDHAFDVHSRFTEEAD